MPSIGSLPLVSSGSHLMHLCWFCFFSLHCNKPQPLIGCMQSWVLCESSGSWAGLGTPTTHCGWSLSSQKPTLMHPSNRTQSFSVWAVIMSTPRTPPPSGTRASVGQFTCSLLILWRAGRQTYSRFWRLQSGWLKALHRNFTPSSLRLFLLRFRWVKLLFSRRASDKYLQLGAPSWQNQSLWGKSHKERCSGKQPEPRPLETQASSPTLTVVLGLTMVSPWTRIQDMRSICANLSFPRLL